MNIEEFIKSKIETVDQLRLVLLLYGQPSLRWDMSDLAGKLYIPVSAVQSAIARLGTQGLVEATGESPLYSFRCESPECEALMKQLAALDRERPVSLLQMIYPPAHDIQAFTDAFRIKWRKDN